MNVIDASDRTRLASLLKAGLMPSPELRDTVGRVVDDVRARGDVALAEHAHASVPSAEFAQLRVPIPTLESAKGLVPPEIAEALHVMKERVTRFHERQRHADLNFEDEFGGRYNLHAQPLDSVAAYVPAGPSASAVIMCAVPARIAGVGRTVVFTPALPVGRAHPAILFACSLCEVDELYAVGGPAAIAAAAFGTASIPPVDKIVGNGDATVAEAKRQVFGACDIDGLAGASEVLVVADEGASSEYIVGELLAKAELDGQAHVAVLSESRSLLDAVAQLLDTLDVKTLARGSVIAEVMAHSCYIIHAQSRDEVFSLIEWLAPQHLSLMVRDAAPYVKRIRNVGAIFVGDMTPGVWGDYLSGANFELPPHGASRFLSGLSLASFMRTFPIVENSREGMLHDAPVAAALADYEGLSAHALAARMRNGI